MGNTMLQVLGDWLGSIPGRLSILGIAFATLFATMSGSSLASSTVMATVLTPEMEKQGYKKPMSLGRILGGGGLAMMIPPSGLAIILAAIAKISVAKILIGGAIPGLTLAAHCVGNGARTRSTGKPMIVLSRNSRCRAC